MYLTEVIRSVPAVEGNLALSECSLTGRTPSAAFLPGLVILITFGLGNDSAFMLLRAN